MATSLVNFSNQSDIADPQATSRCMNIEYAVHTTGIMTTFIINQNLVAMTTTLENLSKIFEIGNQKTPL